MLELRAHAGFAAQHGAAVRRASDTIVHSSSEIASGSMDLSARTEQTAANLEESAGVDGRDLLHRRATRRPHRRAASRGRPTHRSRRRRRPRDGRVVQTMEASAAPRRASPRSSAPSTASRSDQHPRRSTRRWSHPRRRAGPRLRGGGRRGAHAGAALGRRRAHRSKAHRPAASTRWKPCAGIIKRARGRGGSSAPRSASTSCSARSPTARAESQITWASRQQNRLPSSCRNSTAGR